MQFAALHVATRILHGATALRMRADLPVLLSRVGRGLHLRDPRCALRARRFYRALFISLLLLVFGERSRDVVPRRASVTIESAYRPVYGKWNYNRMFEESRASSRGSRLKTLSWKIYFHATFVAIFLQTSFYRVKEGNVHAERKRNSCGNYIFDNSII